MMFLRWAANSTDFVYNYSSFGNNFSATYHSFRIMVRNNIYVSVFNSTSNTNFNKKIPNSHLSKCRILKSITFKMSLLSNPLMNTINQNLEINDWLPAII